MYEKKKRKKVRSIKIFDVDTSVYGTVVQEDLGQRRRLSKGKLSRETLVQEDSCPREL